MPRKATKATTKRNTTSHLSARPAKGQDVGRHLTSDAIAADIQAFRKQGGRIEVLGNTPLNRVNVTAFRSKGNTQQKPAAAAKQAAPKVAAQR